MTQTTTNRRNRTINCVIGILLATLHAAASVNFLMNSSRFEEISATPLMEACVKAAWIASGLALPLTVAVLVLVKRVKWLPSILMVLLGNYLCPFIFWQVFQPLFNKAVNSSWTKSSLLPDPHLILYEVLKLYVFDCMIGLFAGLVVSGLAALADYSSRPLPSKE